MTLREHITLDDLITRALRDETLTADEQTTLDALFAKEAAEQNDRPSFAYGGDLADAF